MQRKKKSGSNKVFLFSWTESIKAYWGNLTVFFSLLSHILFFYVHTLTILVPHTHTHTNSWTCTVYGTNSRVVSASEDSRCRRKVWKNNCPSPSSPFSRRVWCMAGVWAHQLGAVYPILVKKKKKNLGVTYTPVGGPTQVYGSSNKCRCGGNGGWDKLATVFNKLMVKGNFLVGWTSQHECNRSWCF